jgi:hypothetical protein
LKADSLRSMSWLYLLLLSSPKEEGCDRSPSLGELIIIIINAQFYQSETLYYLRLPLNTHLISKSCIVPLAVELILF